MAAAVVGDAHSRLFGWQRMSLPKENQGSPERRSECSNETLVKAAQTGDRAAFGVLYQRYSRMVHGILLGRVPHLAVDDLVQDVFLHILPRLGSLRDAARFGPWLAATTRNLAADFHRRSKPAHPLDDESGSEAQNRPDGDLAAEDRLALLNALRALPEAYREPLILRFVEGMTGPEIAERLGLKHGSVRVNLHRGMQLLRETWQSPRSSVGSETRP